MSDKEVVFLENENGDAGLTAMEIRSRQLFGRAVKPKLVVLFKKWGLAKTERQAYGILVGLILATAGFAIFIFVWFVFDVRPAIVEVNPNLNPAYKSVLPPNLKSNR